jgi:hypothetical protein
MSSGPSLVFYVAPAGFGMGAVRHSAGLQLRDSRGGFGGQRRFGSLGRALCPLLFSVAALVPISDAGAIIIAATALGTPLLAKKPDRRSAACLFRLPIPSSQIRACEAHPHPEVVLLDLDLTP